MTAPDPEDLKKTTSAFDGNLSNINTSASSNNYRYDALGNLIYDEREQIDHIDWTVAGKVRSVAKATGPSLNFGYGASGQRIMKQVGEPGTDAGAYREHYIRDAQGNIMATYRYTNATAASLELKERPIYGSSRLGSYAKTMQLYNAQAITSYPPPSNIIQRPHLRYELTDHLGNVAAAVTGRLLPSQSLAPFEADLVSAQGYEPFGSLLPGRNYSSDAYRFGFQGQEKDNEIYGSNGTAISFEYRVHDARVGRFLSLDPIASSYPWNSPFAFSENRVIDGTELEGLEFIRYVDAKIKVWYNGEVHINLKKCSESFQDTWRERDIKLRLRGGNLSLGGRQYLGAYPTRISSITFSLYAPDETNWGAKGLERLNDLNGTKADNAAAHSRIHRYNNNSNKLDQRFADHKVVARAMRNAKGSLLFEAATVGYDAYSGWKEAFYDGPQRNRDITTISQQQGLVIDAVGAVQDFLNNHSVNPALMAGENGPNLMAYVIMGEKRGSNEGVFQLGDAILNSIGLNRYEKTRTYLPIDISGSSGTRSDSSNPHE